MAIGHQYRGRSILRSIKTKQNSFDQLFVEDFDGIELTYVEFWTLCEECFGCDFIVNSDKLWVCILPGKILGHLGNVLW